MLIGKICWLWCHGGTAMHSCENDTFSQCLPLDKRGGPLYAYWYLHLPRVKSYLSNYFSEYHRMETSIHRPVGHTVRKISFRYLVIVQCTHLGDLISRNDLSTHIYMWTLFLVKHSLYVRGFVSLRLFLHLRCSNRLPSRVVFQNLVFLF